MRARRMLARGHAHSRAALEANTSRHTGILALQAASAGPRALGFSLLTKGFRWGA